MHLELTKKFFRTGDVESIHFELNEYFVVDKPVPRIHKSVDLIEIIIMLGTAAEWLGLREAVKVYFTTLAKHAADATWNKLASLKETKEVKPLVDVASTLTTAAVRVDEKVIIIIGINTPDNNFGTQLSIQPTDVEGVIHDLASFIVHVEELSAAMQREIEAGREPLGAANIEIQDDGSLLIKWIERNMKEHLLRIP